MLPDGQDPGAADQNGAQVLYEFLIDSQPYSVEITPGQARINGKDIPLEDLPGHMLLGTRSVAYDVVRAEDGTPTAVVLQGKVVPVRYLRGGLRQASREGTGDGQVKAPMNGVVVRVLAQVGQPVEAGQVVLVLEAMKMENEVTAPLAGVLTELAVQAGVTVNPGEPLFRVGND